MKRNVYRSSVFTGGRPICTQILPNRVISHQPFLASENERHWATRWRRPHHSALFHFDTTPECDGQTDGQTDGNTV